MSIKKPQLIIYLIFALSIYFYQSLGPKQMTRKSFSAVNVSQFSSHGVVDRIINLKIEVKNENEITSVISLPFDFEEGLEYKWILGQNVILKEGALTGKSEIGFRKDQTKKIKIKVAGFDSKNNRHIGFEVWGTKNNRRLFAEGLISSQTDKSFEAVVQNVERSKIEKSCAKK